MAAKFAHHIQAGKDTSMFWAAEPFDSREGYHFHALINTFGKITNDDMYRYWTNEKQHGHSHFVKIHRALGKEEQIECYCSKYISKHLADYDIYTAKNLTETRSTGLPEKPDYISNFQNYD